MRKVTFTETIQHETEGRKKGPTYEAGTHHTLRDDLAAYFVQRGVAGDYDAKAAAASAATAASGAKEKPATDPGKSAPPDGAKV